MMGLLKLIDITFVSNQEYSDPDEILDAQRTSLAYIPYVDERISVTVIKHWRKYAVSRFGKAAVYFFAASKHFFFIPFKTLLFVKKQNPDIVIVQGFNSPLQVLLLKYMVDRRTKIVIQHHGGEPNRSPKKKLQQWAGRCVDAFFFTANANAAPWLRSGIVPDKTVCYEILEASTFLRPTPRLTGREKLKIKTKDVFLWVGRLNANKDPLTVLRGFSLYAKDNPDSGLYMIYQTEELSDEINKLITTDPVLHKTVYQLGRLPNTELADWYSAADFYISGSHAEGSGYALIEAMACGCIPVVTDIPSFRKITGDGAYGFLYEAGKENALYNLLTTVKNIDRELLSEKIHGYFEEELSFSSIGKRLSQLVITLCSK